MRVVVLNRLLVDHVARVLMVLDQSGNVSNVQKGENFTLACLYLLDLEFKIFYLVGLVVHGLIIVIKLRGLRSELR
jgi:hypothetical protein